MLVLTRKAGEEIVIDGKIRVVIVRAGETVRVGIHAPRDVVILRKEVADLKEVERERCKNRG